MSNPWQHEPRKRLTDQDRTRVFLARDGICSQCSRKLSVGDDWIVEHVLALECGGTNDWANLLITCMWCKPSKDAADHKQAGKQRQSATKHFLPKSEKHTKTRPMPGTKRSGWKHKINGDWVRR